MFQNLFLHFFVNYFTIKLTSGCFLLVNDFINCFVPVATMVTTILPAIIVATESPLYCNNQLVVAMETAVVLCGLLYIIFVYNSMPIL